MTRNSNNFTPLMILLLAALGATFALAAARAPQPSVVGARPAAGKAVHPSLIYQPADRAKILERLKAGADKNSPDYTLSMVAWYRGTRFETHILPAYKYEGPRADAVHKLAIVTWLTPDARRLVKPDPVLATYLDCVRTAVKSITMPAGRQGDHLVDEGGAVSGWGFVLDAGPALWNYALAYDLLASPEVAAAGLEPAVLDDFYRRIADGAFHHLVAHIRTFKTGTAGNNWNAREYAGIGMACLAFKDRFEAEPAGSQRRKDYDDGLRLVRQLSREFLESWVGPHGAGPAGAGFYSAASYYYEGPHYLRYWVEYLFPFAQAHRRVFPNEAWQEDGPDRPMARYLRGHALALMATHVAKNGSPGWSQPPIDDNWLEPSDAEVPLVMAAAWLGDKSPQDKAVFVQRVRQIGGRGHILLLGHPALDEIRTATPAGLPPVESLPWDGLAVARTGSTPEALTAVLKNTRTIFKDGVPSTVSHAHADNGQLLAYCNCEAILIDPGYGSGGYGNKNRVKFFTSWEQHNVLLVEDEAGYPPQVNFVSDRKFMLPVFGASESAPVRRITRCERAKDALGEFNLIEAATPAHKRTVIQPDDRHLIVVDRLDKPRRIKLCWFGNGSAEDDPATAAVDLAQAEARYSRGAKNETLIKVLLPGGHETKAVAGEYGPAWAAQDPPLRLTGMHVTSRGPVAFTVTAVAIADKKDPKDKPALDLKATADQGPGGEIRISLTSGDQTQKLAVRRER